MRSETGSSATKNRPFSTCCEPHYESEAKRKAFHMKISFVCIRTKTNFHNKNCTKPRSLKNWNKRLGLPWSSRVRTDPLFILTFEGVL